MWKSDIYKTFNSNRNEFSPYGLTIEKWRPELMCRFDRHNEIEINYLIEGSITYLVNGRKVTIPSGRIVMFWGLMSHQIIDFEKSDFYYVCTIPLSTFLLLNLPKPMIDRVLKGDVLVERESDKREWDIFLFEQWFCDINSNNNVHASTMEMNGRLHRFFNNIDDTICQSSADNTNSKLHSTELKLIDKMVLFIAKNYSNGIKVTDVGKEVGLHPDYANNIFKKAFNTTISEYIITEKILHAQRLLIMEDKSITDIVYDSGFNSISCFNSAFMKINGCTPREYRKNNKML